MAAFEPDSMDNSTTETQESKIKMIILKPWLVDTKVSKRKCKNQ